MGDKNQEKIILSKNKLVFLLMPVILIIYLILPADSVNINADIQDYYENYENNKNYDGFLRWTFGTGEPKNGKYTLFSPTTAREIDNGRTILIADCLNNRVVEVDKELGEVIFEYNQNNIGIPIYPHDASLDCYGNVIVPTNYPGYHKVLILKRRSGKILWEYDIENPREAIEWDNKTIVISTPNTLNNANDGVYWINKSDKSTVKYYSIKGPLGLTRLEPRQSTDESGLSILIGSDNSYVREVLYSDLSTLWQYGIVDSHPNEMNAYDRGMLTHWAVRIGMSAGTRNPYLTIISDNEGEKVYAVNHDKIKVWELGGAISRNRPTAENLQLICPHGLSMTSRGTLLIVDGHGNRVFEVDPTIPPEKPDYYEAIPVWEYETTDSLQTAGKTQIRGYNRISVKLWNYGNKSIKCIVSALIDSYGTSIWETDDYINLNSNQTFIVDIPKPATLVEIKAISSQTNQPGNLRAWIIMDK